MFKTECPPFSAGELALFHQSPLASWIIASGHGAVLTANIAATDYIPRTGQHTINECLFSHFCRNDDQQRIDSLLQGKSITESGSLGVFRLLTKEETERNVTLYASPFTISGHTGWQITAVPVSEKANQASLLSTQKPGLSEDFYRHLIFEASYGTALCDASGQVQFVTSAVETILGFKPDDILGKNIFSFVHPQDIEWAMHSFGMELKGTPEYKSIVIRLQNSTGGYTWCMVRGHNLLQHPGVEKFAVYFHDDSQRKTAIDALKASEERFRALVRDLPVGVLLLNSDGAIQVANGTMSRILRQPEPELPGKSLWDLVPHVVDEDGNYLHKEQRPVYESLTHKKPVQHRVNGFWMPERNEYQWLLINADPVLDEGGNLQYLLCSFTDLTERRKLTQRLLHEKINQQRLLAQATLDGQERERREIGKELHDNIGQQLTTIKLYLDMAGVAATTDESKQILDHALRCVSGTINEVRQISHQLVPHSLQDLGLVESIAELCATIMKTGKLEVSFDHDGFVEHKLDHRLKLALFRIVQEQLTNTIRHAGAKMVAVTLTRHNEEVLLSVADNGAGFEPDQVRKGLGLTNIQNRVELFGGTMQVIAAPGCGCTLEVVVPV